MTQNGHQQAPQPQQTPPTFQRIVVFTEDGTFDHPYAKHSINMGPDGGVVLVQETKDDQLLSIYPLNRVKRITMTPTKLTVV